MNTNTKGSEDVALLAVLNPISQSAATVVTGWVSVANFQKFLAILDVGVMASTSTIDAKLRQATDSSGTSAKDITGKAITQLTQAGGNGNQQVMINLRSEDLDGTNGFTYFALSVTVGTAASLIAAQVLGLNPRYSPASASNPAAVVQVV